MSDEKPELSPKQKEWLRLASLPTGHPERHGYAKCANKACGAYRPKAMLLSAEAGSMAGRCAEGCAPRPEALDPRRCLRIGSPPGSAVDGPVVRPMAAEASIESVISDHLEPRLIDPVICPHGNRRDSDCPRCAEMRALIAQLEPEVSS